LAATPAEQYRTESKQLQEKSSDEMIIHQSEQIPSS
jgi:hypothetical protein